VYPRPWAKPSTSKGKASFGSYDEGSQDAAQETADCQMTDHTRRIRSCGPAS